jgi:RNA polymerase sigma factor (TIGR02999 family)
VSRADEPSPDVTQLLVAWRAGDAEALPSLVPLVYRELRQIAARYLAHERSGHLLQSTALVHEAFLKLVDQTRVDWQNRAHYYGVAAQMMRRILVDQARYDKRQKRGGAAIAVSLTDVADDMAAPSGDVHPVDALALDRALTRLEALDPTQAKVVELRFFGGLSIEETATVLDVSSGTVKREWAVARAWLYRELEGQAPSDA